MSVTVERKFTFAGVFSRTKEPKRRGWKLHTTMPYPVLEVSRLFMRNQVENQHVLDYVGQKVCNKLREIVQTQL